MLLLLLCIVTLIAVFQNPNMIKKRIGKCGRIKMIFAPFRFQNNTFTIQREKVLKRYCTKRQNWHSEFLKNSAFHNDTVIIQSILFLTFRHRLLIFLKKHTQYFCISHQGVTQENQSCLIALSCFIKPLPKTELDITEELLLLHVHVFF